MTNWLGIADDDLEFESGLTANYLDDGLPRHAASAAGIDDEWDKD